MHSWLPDAHSEAPSLVSALLSGALLNCACVLEGTVRRAGDDTAYVRELIASRGVAAVPASAFALATSVRTWFTEAIWS